MPKGKQKRKGKGKKGGKVKGKGKGKRKGKKAAGNVEDGEAKRLLKTYEKNCIEANSKMCPGIRKLLRSAAEEGNIVTKFILESAALQNEGDMPVLFDPLIVSLRQQRYLHVQEIHVWDYPMTFENIATLALFLEKRFYPIRTIELLDCLIDAPAVSRLASPFNICDLLTTLILDYNEFGDIGCKNLSTGLEGNTTMLSLSLCYCNLKVESGKYLGHTVSTTAIRELYLDGNELQCEGAVELIKLLVDQASIEAYQREEQAKKKEEEEALKAEQEKQRRLDGEAKTDGSASEKEDEKSDNLPSDGGTKKKKKKGKRKRKKKEPKGPPPVGPWIHKLHLADNGIDGYGDGGSFAPIICMRLFKKLIMNSKYLEELDLEDNTIGELGGREILEGLKYRKEIKLGGCKVCATHTITTDTFNSVIKFGSGLTKKRARRKGKKKK